MALSAALTSLHTYAHSAERADDLPLLVRHLVRLGVRDVCMQISHPGACLTDGEVLLLWLTHVLSQGSGKVRQLHVWAASHTETLNWCFGHSVDPVELREERLRAVLQLLADDAIWQRIEMALNAKTHVASSEPLTLRVAALDDTWRLDTDGTIRFSQARGWRAERVQPIAVFAEPHNSLVSLWCMPSGQTTVTPDLITYIRSCLTHSPLIVTGDAAVSPELRATIVAGRDEYLVAASGPVAETLVRGEEAVAFDAAIGSARAAWVERRFRAQSPLIFNRERDALWARLFRARDEIVALGEARRGRQRPRTADAVRRAAHELISAYGVEGLLRITIEEDVAERTVRRYAGRPTQVRADRSIRVAVLIDEEAVGQLAARAGWRVIATSLTGAEPVFAAALVAASEPVSGFERLHGRPLSISPGALRSPDLVLGLLRLMSLALRATSLLDRAAGRDRLDESGRRTTRPAFERVLDTFCDIALVGGNPPEITPLTPLQRSMLAVLDLPAAVYGER